MLARGLEQSTELEDHMQSIIEYASMIDVRREIFRQLGLRMELGQTSKNGYADVAIISSEFLTPNNTPRVT